MAPNKLLLHRVHHFHDDLRALMGVDIKGDMSLLLEQYEMMLSEARLGMDVKPDFLHIPTDEIADPIEMAQVLTIFSGQLMAWLEVDADHSEPIGWSRAPNA